MKSIVMSSILAALLAATADAQTKPSIEGSWELKSVKIGSKPAAAKDLIGLLRGYGDCELKMQYRLSPDHAARINEVDGWYEYNPGARTLQFEPNGKDTSQSFGVKFIGDKQMQLRFKENNKVVEMLFTREEE